MPKELSTFRTASDRETPVVPHVTWKCQDPRRKSRKFSLLTCSTDMESDLESLVVNAPHSLKPFFGWTSRATDLFKRAYIWESPKSTCPTVWSANPEAWERRGGNRNAFLGFPLIWTLCQGMYVKILAMAVHIKGHGREVQSMVHIVGNFRAHKYALQVTYHTYGIDTEVPE